MKRIHLIISGDVQGVGFRAWFRRYTRDKAITGWIKNREDGAVEIVAEGIRSDLDECIVQCRRGPEIAWVKRVHTTWEDATGEFTSFEVVY